MGRYSSDTGGTDWTPAPAGTHLARFIKLIDLGTQHGEYLGKPKTQNQVLIQWELPMETIMTEDKGEQPLIVSRFYTNSLSEKAHLRHDLEAVRGKPFTVEELMSFDLNAVLGKPCIVTIAHVTKDGKTKAKVTAATAVTKGTTVPPIVNSPSAFWLDEWDDNAFEELPEGFRKIIAQSDEYKAMHAPSTAKSPPPPIRGVHPDPLDDDIPF